jgi:PAS domain S-box-containing protein
MRGEQEPRVSSAPHRSRESGSHVAVTQSFDVADVMQLVERLSQAESELAEAVAGNLDSIVSSAGESYLLRAAQQALLESEALAQEQASLLAAVLENAPDYVVYAGTDRRIRYANKVPPNFLEEGEAVIGADWLLFCPSDQRDAIKRVFEDVVATGEGSTLDGPGRPLGESVPYFSRRFASVTQDGEIVGVVIVVRDITDQRSAEAQLVASERMACVGTLAAGVAHEINNPLAAVIANLDMAALDIKQLSDSVKIPADLEDEISDARGAADRVRSIVRDLKIFSRAENDKRVSVDVERVLESSLRMASNEIRHRARVVTEYGRIPSVEANETRLGQVFLNLVLNAAQAIPEGDVANNLIRITTSCDASNRVLITISDSGPGIPLDVQKRLFTPFFTTKPVGAGTGLGLSICERIVTALGGEIGFESQIGKGTSFRICLPAARQDRPQAPEPVVTVPHAARRGRVLVVDDEIYIGAVVQRILIAEHDVVVVDSAARALEVLRDDDFFDVILCDLMMPQITGMELHAELLRRDPGQAERMVFVTGGAFTPWARQFLDSVSNPRIEKPFGRQGLRAMVNGLIR